MYLHSGSEQLVRVLEHELLCEGGAVVGELELKEVVFVCVCLGGVCGGLHTACSETS